jgi:hypothetical protein
VAFVIGRLFGLAQTGTTNAPKAKSELSKTIFRSDTQPLNRCFLLISHEGSEYLGCLLFDDQAFCRQVMELLKAHCNRTIAEIGSLDVSHTF